MEITVEISYLPLLENYQQPVNDFVRTLERKPGIKVETGMMSSLLSGSYEEIMPLLYQEMKPFMEKYPSVFTLRLSNSCNICNK